RPGTGPFPLDLGTTETLSVNGINGDDTFAVNSLSGVTDLTTVNLNGFDGNDTFTVTPAASVAVNVIGNLPTPPGTPGDVLSVNTAGTISPALTSTSTPNGLQGSYTFADRQTVTFRGLEALGATANLSITVTDSPDPAAPGQSLTYTIVVTNLGSVAVNGVSVTDAFPVELTNVTYTSTVTGGASGNTTSGSGDINDMVTLPAGSTITYTVTGDLPPSLTGSLSNTATVAPPPGSDPDMTNNSDTETTTLVPQADISVTLSDSPDPVIAGQDLTYTITVVSAGPSDAQNLTLADVIPGNTTF